MTQELKKSFAHGNPFTVRNISPFTVRNISNTPKLWPQFRVSRTYARLDNRTRLPSPSAPNYEHP